MFSKGSLKIISSTIDVTNGLSCFLNNVICFTSNRDLICIYKKWLSRGCQDRA